MGFNQSSVNQFYAEHVGKSFYGDLSSAMTSDVCIGMELVRENAVNAWREVIGPTNSGNAKKEAPRSIRAKFGVDGTLNAVHGADAPTSYQRECEFWFGGEPA